MHTFYVYIKYKNRFCILANSRLCVVMFKQVTRIVKFSNKNFLLVQSSKKIGEIKK